MTVLEGEEEEEEEEVAVVVVVVVEESSQFQVVTVCSPAEATHSMFYDNGNNRNL